MAGICLPTLLPHYAISHNVSHPQIFCHIIRDRGEIVTRVAEFDDCHMFATDGVTWWLQVTMEQTLHGDD